MGQELSQSQGVIANRVGGNPERFVDQRQPACSLRCSLSVAMRQLGVIVNQQRNHREVARHHFGVFWGEGLQLHPDTKL